MPESIEQDLEKILGALTNLMAADGNTQAVKILAAGKASTKETDHDGWNGGQTGYTVYIEIPQHLYYELNGKQNDIEGEFQNRVTEITRLYDGQWIAGFVITTQLVEDPRWREKASHWCDMNDATQGGGPKESDESVEINTTTPDQDRFPDLSQIRSAVLKNSARARKVVSHTVIKDRHTDEVHHDAITIKTWKKGSKESRIDYKHSISLDSDGEDEIQKLLTFLLTVRKGASAEGSGSFVVVDAGSIPDPAALQQLLNSVSATGKADALASVLQAATDDVAVFDALIERASRDPHMFAEAGAALNLAAFKAAVIELRNLIDKPGVSEQEFQRHLEKYPWIFGSEYSELLDRRNWTRDEKQDFVVRRTTDGYIEIIEIKTPLNGAKLFLQDKSHDSFYASSELSKVIGQVENYIGKLDANRHQIRADDYEDTNKIRAKIVIGRDGTPEEQAALRTFNGHLHRIEVITFDQLLRIAERVIAYLESSLQPAEEHTGQS